MVYTSEEVGYLSIHKRTPDLLVYLKKSNLEIHDFPWESDNICLLHLNIRLKLSFICVIYFTFTVELQQLDDLSNLTINNQVFW